MGLKRHRDTRRKKRVHFRLEAAKAKQVSLVVQLNRFEKRKYPMNKEDNHGHWKKILVLPPGRYRYRFSVDGRWVNDPENERKLLEPGGSVENELLVYLPMTKEL
jgi:1,4-alpha-glucan branching enzyme